MLEGIEALIALESFGTVSEAATRLRLTQSAVSKRLAALQTQLGFRLTEPSGRRIRLTPEATVWLAQARPHYVELQSLGNSLKSPAAGGSLQVTLAIADSLAASWAPSVVRRALEKAQGLTVELHAHRSLLLIESVRLGRYHAGLCTSPSSPGDLVERRITEEPFVFVYGTSNHRTKILPVITIEESSATWSAIAPAVMNEPWLRARDFLRVETFSAALQMVRAGFGDGLLPLALVRENRIEAKRIKRLKVSRPVSLLTRKTISHLPLFEKFTQELMRQAKERFASPVTSRLD